MYHLTIQKLDSAASDFHDAGMLAEKNAAHRLAGIWQQRLLASSPYPRTRRWLDAQWAWALGHLGLLYQLIRWLRLHEPQTQLILATDRAANPWFLQALAPFLTIISPAELARHREEAMANAVYFGCPDGAHSLVSFYKMIEAECRDIHLLTLSAEDRAAADALLAELGVRRPYVALHARSSTHEPLRNVTDEQIADAILPYTATGFQVVSTGLDPHPLAQMFPSVATLPNAQRASFLLSAACDQFIGSNSGAWVIAHAYQRPVEIMNDLEQAAWIYP